MPVEAVCKALNVKFYTKKERRDNWYLLRANGFSPAQARIMRDWSPPKIFLNCLLKAQGLI